MKYYVCGFLFSGENEERVALIRKDRPTWQAGKLNAIGGHIEDHETGMTAMTREFTEETGLEVNAWIHYCTIEYPKVIVFFYRETCDHEYALKGQFSETKIPGWYSVDQLKDEEIIYNLSWLIPMAKIEHSFEWPYRIEVRKSDPYQGEI